MKTIYKYQLLKAICEIQMPIGSRILDVQVQNGVICLWATVDTALMPETRIFQIIGTGDSEVDNCHNYIGTVQQDSFVWHIFERKEE